MKKSGYILVVLILLLASALACNFGFGGDEEEPTTVPPTEEAPAQAPTEQTPAEAPPTEPPPTEPAPTEPPATEPAPTEPPTTEPPPVEVEPEVALELDPTPFTHPQGIFELPIPEGWLVDSVDGSANFSAPDDSGFINVDVFNTGLSLDLESFERFADARDEYFFADEVAYEFFDKEVDADLDQIWIFKYLEFDGIPQFVGTLYDKYEDIIYVIDFWADENVADAYAEIYDEIAFDFLVDNGTASEELGVYDWVHTFFGPADLFSIEVPTGWRYEFSEGENTVVDTFYSPDEHAVIQNVAYDDGTEISRSEAGAFGLELLKTFYASDIRVTDDQVQPDGSERLIWDSASGDFSGISFIETRGTTFLLFSVLWDNPFEGAYIDSLNYTIGTYEVP